MRSSAASVVYMRQLVEDGEYAKIASTGRAGALFTALVGTVYGVWLVYAAGIKYLLLAVIFLALGIPLYVYSRRQQGAPVVFTSGEKQVAGLLIAFAVVAAYVFARGLVKI